MLKLATQPIRRATLMAIFKSFHLSSDIYSCQQEDPAPFLTRTSSAGLWIPACAGMTIWLAMPFSINKCPNFKDAAGAFVLTRRAPSDKI